MRILYITPKINDEGGVARILSVKANYLAEKWGYDVHILTQNGGSNRPFFFPFNDTISLHDMTLRGNKISFFLEYHKALKKTLNALNPDVIIVCDNGLKAYTIPFILKTSIPIVFECHGSKYIQEKEGGNPIVNKIKLIFKDFAANKFTRFIALSEENLKEWKVKNGIVIANPLWFEPQCISNLKSKKVIAVARHSYEKGLDRLIYIWQKVSQKYPDWTLEIYGKPDVDQKIQQLVSSLNIIDTVIFFEPVENIRDKYLDASIAVMTSRTEGFGMVLIEAMALGLPAVAYDCPCGPRTVIQNNENGFLIEDGNTASFVQKLELLMKDENLRIEMGAKAQKSIKKYNLDTIMNQWKSLFEAIVKQ